MYHDKRRYNYSTTVVETRFKGRYSSNTARVSLLEHSRFVTPKRFYRNESFQSDYPREAGNPQLYNFILQRIRFTAFAVFSRCQFSLIILESFFNFKRFVHMKYFERYIKSDNIIKDLSFNKINFIIIYMQDVYSNLVKICPESFLIFQVFVFKILKENQFIRKFSE